jgi:Tfp pilus assembly protein PilX
MRARLQQERGIALVMALGTMMTLTIVVAATIEFTSSNSRATHSGEARSRTVQIAEAGMNEALAILSIANDKRSPTALPSGSATYAGGSASWSGSVNGDIWTITSTSTVKNPTGAADLHHTLTTQARVAVDGVGLAPAWQYVYTDSTTTCMNVSQTAEIALPFYIKGDLCLSNSVKLTATKITVGGKITMTNTSGIGKSDAYITELHTGGGCSRNASGPWSTSNCTAANSVYVTNPVDTTVGSVSKPTVDLSYYYLNSKPGPRNNCTSGSFPGGFDSTGSTTMDHSRSTVTLLPSTAYSCTFTSGSSTLGKIIWTPGTPGTLQVSGVIFFDGDIQLNGQAIYQGRAVIYTSGTVTFQNTDYLCGATDCNVDAWDGDSNMITFVSGACTESPAPSSAPGCIKPSGFGGDGVVARNSAKFQGGIYAVDDVQQTQSSLLEGPIIARQFYLGNSATAGKWPPIDFIADGAPAPIGSTKIVPLSGTWGG